MVTTLPAPHVVRCYFDDAFEPPLPVMCLHWADEGAGRTWELPEGVSVTGPAPRCFGITVRRRGPDAYGVRLLWDATGFRWPALSRAQILGSDLGALLEAMGTDLWCLLDQPPSGPTAAPDAAA
ncbi:MAG TPA: hypothetical protein VJ739_00400 [Gemmataceae bacterium]|nr:hypothetical protein [Gemmataceae bacterium]